jgi:uncharacterized OB-fold protein
MHQDDWTKGVERLVYQCCERCQNVWYFRRSFCPRCGSHDVEDCQASGRASVHAITKVVRAPTTEWSDLAPYTILLLDAEEGFRFMAHGNATASIGNIVVLRWIRPLGYLIPWFEVNQPNASPLPDDPA